MIERRWILGVLLILLALASHLSSAHSRFNPAGNIVGRTTDTGVKTGPCGPYARTNTPKVLQSGSTVQVDWQETVQHQALENVIGFAVPNERLGAIARYYSFPRAKGSLLEPKLNSSKRRRIFC